MTRPAPRAQPPAGACIGAAWRPGMADALEQAPRLGLIEVMFEDFEAPQARPVLPEGLPADVPLVPHAVTLSLGGAEVPETARLDALARCAERLGAPFVSEHAAFVRSGGLDAGHLLPLPRTCEMLDVLVDNLRAAARVLPVPLALENVAALFAWPDDEMDEGSFLAEALRQADCRLLLDLANLHANACNLGSDPLAFLERVPLERVAYIHVAGGEWHGGLYHDTHAQPVPAPVLELLEELCARVAPAPVVIERDDVFPDAAAFAAEVAAVEAAILRGCARRLEHDGGR